MIKNLITTSLARLGYKVVPDGWNKANLRKSGLDPRVVIDVGAAQGTPRLYEAFPGAHFLLVEPLEENEPALRAILQTYRGDYFLGAAGAAEGEAAIYVEPRSTRSSLLKRTSLTASGKALATRPIKVSTLDSIVAERNLKGPYGLKIDTEGYELQVLRGAQAILRETQFVIAEVSVSKRFEESYAFHEFILEMHKYGFGLSDVLHVARSPKTRDTLFLDAMFRKRDQNATSNGGSS